MCRSISVLLILVLSCGCTHIKLQSKTINQGSTLSGLQYQQVLDNIAMFSCEPNALAWHIKVTGGVVQVSDQGNVGVTAILMNGSQISPNMALARNILEQWNVDTAIESDELELLQLAYQKAVNPADSDRQIEKKIYEKVCELSTTYHIVLSPQVANEMLDSLKRGAPEERAKKLDEIKSRLEPCYERLTEISEKPTSVEAAQAPGGAANPELTAAREDILKLTTLACEQPFIPATARCQPPRCTSEIEKAQDKITGLLELIKASDGETPNQFSTAWLSCGTKRDVPPCACYVGHFHGCQGDCYVWVMPERVQTLRDFTLTILSLAPPESPDDSQPRAGVGAAFTPTSI